MNRKFCINKPERSSGSYRSKIKPPRFLYFSGIVSYQNTVRKKTHISCRWFFIPAIHTIYLQSTFSECRLRFAGTVSKKKVYEYLPLELQVLALFGETLGIYTGRGGRGYVNFNLSKTMFDCCFIIKRQRWFSNGKFIFHDEEMFGASWSKYKKLSSTNDERFYQKMLTNKIWNVWKDYISETMSIN